MTSVYRQELRRRAATDDASFAEYLLDLRFPEHLRSMSRFADRNAQCLVLAPRGHAKTTLFLHRAARLIGVHSGMRRLGILTAVDSDAESRSRAIRGLVEHPFFAEVFPWAQAGVEGQPWTDGAWTVKGATLGKDHTVTAMSLGSVRAGARLDDLVADDLVGKQENATAAGRVKALATYLTVVDPMMVPGGTRMFLGTRWHDDDLYASLIRSNWPCVTWQAIQADGTALWPDYLSLAWLEAKRAEQGLAFFNLQYQNDPSGMGGNIFKRDWFQYVDNVPPGTRRVGVDLAVVANERSDYTAAVEWVEDADLNLYMVGAWRQRLEEGHRAWLTGVADNGLPITDGPLAAIVRAGPRLLWPMPSLPPGFAGAYETYPVPRTLGALNIEAVQSQILFVREMLRTSRLPTRPVYPDKDKVARSRALAIRYEQGKVFHVRGAPGLDDLESEMVAFPNAEHDDLVDAAGYGAAFNDVVEFSYTSVPAW
jgi:predicted phage terminase large subunit-like protein